MQIHYRGAFIVLLAGMALASAPTFPEQSTAIEQGLSRRQTAHWADINAPTSVSIDFMGDAATVNTTVLKDA